MLAQSMFKEHYYPETSTEASYPEENWLEYPKTHSKKMKTTPVANNQLHRQWKIDFPDP